MWRFPKRFFSVLRAVPRDHWAIAALALILAGGIGYTLFREREDIALLSARAVILQQELDTTTRVLQESIAETHSALSGELSREQENAAALRRQLGSVEGAVGTISGTVNTLEKLSQTDPELLQKYSRVYFLNENYTPERLAAIDKKYLYDESRPESFNAEAWPRLKRLLDDAGARDVTLYVRSAYRSFDEQAALKSAYTVVYGSGANTFSADQGYSEHQLGTTIDFITTGLGGKLDGFENTPPYQWLLDNAYRYGFVLSYPEENRFYVFEPWHWRYVGIKLASDLHAAKKHFYDMEQRDIDTYLVNLFD